MLFSHGFTKAAAASAESFDRCSPRQPLDKVLALIYLLPQGDIFYVGYLSTNSGKSVVPDFAIPPALFLSSHAVSSSGKPVPQSASFTTQHPEIFRMEPVAGYDGIAWYAVEFRMLSEVSLSGEIKLTPRN